MKTGFRKEADTHDTTSHPHQCQPRQSLHAAQIADALLKKEAVSEITGVSISTMYRWMAEGKFPSAVRLSSRCTRWRAGDVMAWLRERAVAQGVAQ